MHTLKPLPYAYDALEPHYDEATLKIHHDKHHQAYVDKLNEALKGHADLEKLSLEQLLTRLDEVPQPIRKKVRDNAGGVWNHDFFWNCMGSGKSGVPSGKVAKLLDASFGSFPEFRAAFKESALAMFGSGWTFLVHDDGGGLKIENFANQDCPLSKEHTPLLALDVWEHAYYLKFQNRRPEWVDSWWNVVDWDAVGKRL
jgi:Fe-Mn family superoxide dismutase